jgi:hypothetical protein
MYSFLSYLHFYFICILRWRWSHESRGYIRSYTAHFVPKTNSFFQSTLFSNACNFSTLPYWDFLSFSSVRPRKLRYLSKYTTPVFFLPDYSFTNSEVDVKVGESRLVKSREYFLWTLSILHLSRQWTISKENNTWRFMWSCHHTARSVRAFGRTPIRWIEKQQ